MTDREKQTKRYYVDFEIEVPCFVTDEQVEDWVRFEASKSGSLSLSNPLVDRDLEALWFTVRVRPI